MAISLDELKQFLGLFVAIFQNCFLLLSSIRIAGLSMFEWILGFMAAGAIFSIIRAFAGVGSVSVTGVASGAAEQIRSGQAEWHRKAEQRARESERAAELAKQERKNAAERRKREKYTTVRINPK